MERKLEENNFATIFQTARTVQYNGLEYLCKNLMGHGSKISAGFILEKKGEKSMKKRESSVKGRSLAFLCSQNWQSPLTLTHPHPKTLFFCHRKARTPAASQTYSKTTSVAKAFSCWELTPSSFCTRVLYFRYRKHCNCFSGNAETHCNKQIKGQRFRAVCISLQRGMQTSWVCKTCQKTWKIRLSPGALWAYQEPLSNVFFPAQVKKPDSKNSSDNNISHV